MFNIGQRVVCVDDASTTIVKKGNIYTVCGAGISPLLKLPLLFLVEVDGSKFDPGGMYASRFRPIVERKTDISIFTKMLIDKKESVQ